MAIDFNSAYRNTWMFPKNIRKIHPWKMAQICQVLNQMPLNENAWTQEMQNEFSLMLTNGDLKSQNEIRSLQSGGARTYVTQLEILGLIYRKEKKLFFTLAGKSLIDFEEPLKVIQTQLLNLQYPSTYSLGRNVKINPGIKIKPFVFLLQLLKDSSVNYLQQEELLFLIVYGHNSRSYDYVKNKILSYRSAGSNKKELLALIDSPSKDLHIFRSKNNDNASELLKAALDITNTLKNYLVSSALAFENKADRKIYYSSEFDDIVTKAIDSKDSFIPNPEHSESFLRAYGAWNKQKDNTADIQRKKLPKGEAIITSQYFSYVGNRMVIDSAEDFVVDMKNRFGFERAFVEQIISPLIPKSLSFFENKYLELSKGGIITATAFEKATVELFTNTFGFKAKHTGSRYKHGVGGYSDVLLENEESNEASIVDTKATSYYTLSSADYAKMVSNYVPNFNDLSINDKITLGFILYIAGGFGGEIQAKLNSLRNETGVPASAITAKTLIDIAQTQNSKKSLLWDRFKLSKILTTEDFKN